MRRGWRLAAGGLAMAWAAGPATADGGGSPGAPELAVGVFAHGANFHPLGSRLTFPRLPSGQIYEGMEEDGTTDLQRC